MMKAWISAFRLRTLPLALACVFVAGGIVIPNHDLDWNVFVLILLTTIFLQILSNLANDYGDTENGADNVEREGPSRAVQTGEISSKEMKRAIAIFVMLSLCSGIALITYVFGFENWPFLLGFFLLGLCSIAAAIKYTAGKNPYGYAGFGDVFVLLFFGFVGVLGAVYLLGGGFLLEYLLPSWVVGALATGVLNLNNMRDIHSDEIAGKRSIPVRIGLKRAKVYQFVLVVSAITGLTLYTVLNGGWWSLLVIPLLIMNLMKTIRAEGKSLDPLLKPLALSTFVMSLLFFLNYLFSS